VRQNVKAATQEIKKNENAIGRLHRARVTTNCRCTENVNRNKILKILLDIRVRMTEDQP